MSLVPFVSTLGSSNPPNHFDRLPNELLKIIFEDVAAVSERPSPCVSVSRADIGHVLCGVDRRWKGIALSTSLVWELLAILPFEPQDANASRRFDAQIAAWTSTNARSMHVYLWDIPTRSSQCTRSQLKDRSANMLSRVLAKGTRKKWRSLEIITSDEIRMDILLSFVRPHVFKHVDDVTLVIQGSLARPLAVQNVGLSTFPFVQSVHLCHVTLPALPLHHSSVTSLDLTVTAEGAAELFGKLWESLGDSAISLDTLAFMVKTDDGGASALPEEQRAAFVNRSVRHLTLDAACIPPFIVNGSFPVADDLNLKAVREVSRCFEYLGLAGPHHTRQFCNGGTLARNIRQLRIDIHQTTFVGKPFWKSFLSRIPGILRFTLTSEFYEWDPSWPDPTNSSLTIHIAAGAISMWPLLERVVLHGRSADVAVRFLESLVEKYTKKGAIAVDFCTDRETDMWLKADRKRMYERLSNLFKYDVL